MRAQGTVELASLSVRAHLHKGTDSLPIWKAYSSCLDGIVSTQHCSVLDYPWQGTSCGGHDTGSTDSAPRAQTHTHALFGMLRASNRCFISRSSAHQRDGRLNCFPWTFPEALVRGDGSSARRTYAAAAGNTAEKASPNFAPRNTYDETLTFGEDGFAIPHPINGSSTAQQDSSHTTQRESHNNLQDSVSGMLCILQLLPETTSNWVASYVGYHSYSHMLQLRSDIFAGTISSDPEVYCNRDTTAWRQVSSVQCSKAQPQEIIIDDGMASLLRLTDGTEIQLPHTIPIQGVLTALSNLAEYSQTSPELVGPDGVLVRADDSLLAPPEVTAYYKGENKSFKHLFSPLMRAGISGTLHRVSCVLGANHSIVGLTIRIGRHLPLAAWPLTDVLAMVHCEQRRHKFYKHAEQLRDPQNAWHGLPCSVLIIGGPGSGKTTLLRDIAQQMSVRFGLGRKVVVVDSSSEIGGLGVAPHPAIGEARRFVLPNGVSQASILVQALTNHNPDVIIVDELSTPGDIEAARSICHRGVNLIATAHATSLPYLLSNPQMNPVLGGLREVTLGAQELRDLARDARNTPAKSHAQRHAFARNVGARTRQERRQPPCFQVIVEILDRNSWRIHWNAAESIDAVLQGGTPSCELRVLHNGTLLSRDERNSSP